MSVRIVERGDMFAAGAEALVIPTNSVGTMGAGIAEAAAARWPATCATYNRQCRLGLIEPGSVWAARTAMGADSLWVVMVATKLHWRRPSQMRWVEDGLQQLVAWALRERPGSLAVPALGCGNGALPWPEVRPRMEAALSALPRTMAVMIFAPHERATKRPQSGQKGRAA